MSSRNPAFTIDDILHPQNRDDTVVSGETSARFHGQKVLRLFSLRVISTRRESPR